MMKLDDDYLALTAKIAHDIKTASYNGLNMKPGSRHLEVGCGNGYDSIAIAGSYPSSQVTGIDLFSDIVELANQRVQEKGLDNVSHINGDAAEYLFPGTYHSMRAERVFQHLKDDEIHALVAHLANYTETGGVFSLVGVDWDTLTCTTLPRHRQTFLTLKDYLIKVSNIHFIHTAMAAFEANGYRLDALDTYDYRVSSFQAAFTAFNMDNIASEMGMNSEHIKAMRADFVDGKHYFSVGGCTLNFVKEG